MKRIAKGSGTSCMEVSFLVEEHKRFAKMVEKMGKMNLSNPNDLKQMQRNP